jgi:hypothetical protein
MIDMMHRIEKQKMISRLFLSRFNTTNSVKLYVFLCLFAANLLQ